MLACMHTTNRIVWVDVQVANLAKAASFYSNAMNLKFSKELWGGMTFSLCTHNENANEDANEDEYTFCLVA